MDEPADTTGEEWRAIPGAPGYEASSFGRIRSIDRTLPRRTRLGNVVPRRYAGRVLKPCCHGNGYLTVYLPRTDGGNGHRHCLINRLVFAAFVRPPEAWEEIDHGDRVRANNRPDNLSALTVAQNRARRVPMLGVRNPGAKLTEADVIAIRALAGRKPQTAIAAMFGVCRATVGYINAGIIWKHVPAGNS